MDSLLSRGDLFEWVPISGSSMLIKDRPRLNPPPPLLVSLSGVKMSEEYSSSEVVALGTAAVGEVVATVSVVVLDVMLICGMGAC